MNREEHLMVIAVEECGEVAQRLSKALRFGLEQVQEDADDKPEENPQRLTNRERIRREYADLVAAMDMLGFTMSMVFDDEIAAKQLKVEQYLQRSERCGTLDTSPRPPVPASPRQETKG